VTTNTQTNAGTVLVANPELKKRLRTMVERKSLARVADELGLAREPLLRYLADVHLQTGTFRLIESTLAELGAPLGGPLGAV
jgi:hypothetical protein